MKNEYEGSEKGPSTTLSTSEENISLHIPPDLEFPETGWEKNGWELTPLVPVKVRCSFIILVLFLCYLAEEGGVGQL